MLSLRRQAQRARRLAKLKVNRVSPDTAVLSVDRPARVTPLGDRAWLVRKPSPPRRRVRLDRVDGGTWVLRQPGPGSRSLRRIGGKGVGTHLLVDQHAARKHMAQHQLELLHYLAEEHVAWMLRELDVNVVLDVGANRGQYGKKLRKDGYTGRIVSFEPVSGVADRLERNAQGDPDWHVQRYALGDAAGETEIMVAGGQARMSSLLPPSDFGKSYATKLRSDTVETISVRRLDELFAQAVDGIAEPRVYLKLDTQGYDLQAFAGAGECIVSVVGMQSEVSALPIYDGMPSMSEQLETYKAAGFELTGMFPVIVENRTRRVIEFDAVMIRPEALRK